MHTSFLQLFMSRATVAHRASLAGPIYDIITPASPWLSSASCAMSTPGTLHNALHGLRTVRIFVYIYAAGG